MTYEVTSSVLASHFSCLLEFDGLETDSDFLHHLPVDYESKEMISC